MVQAIEALGEVVVGSFLEVIEEFNECEGKHIIAMLGLGLFSLLF